MHYLQHPKYQYQYGVHDDHTHDIKKHTESRDGDKTEGEYSFKEADGTTRVVKYHVHGKSGFVATVHHTGHATHPQPTHHQESGHHDGGFAGYAGYNGGQYWKGRSRVDPPVATPNRLRLLLVYSALFLLPQ